MRHAATSRPDGFFAALGVQCGLIVHTTGGVGGVADLLL